STLVGLITVATTARLLGTLGAALGRIILGAGTVFFARRSMESSAKTHVGNSLPTAVMLAVGVGTPLAIADYLLIMIDMPLVGHPGPLLRLPILVLVFAVAFLSMSRTFRIFHALKEKRGNAERQGQVSGFLGKITEPALAIQEGRSLRSERL